VLLIIMCIQLLTYLTLWWTRWVQTFVSQMTGVQSIIDENAMCYDIDDQFRILVGCLDQLAIPPVFVMQTSGWNKNYRSRDWEPWDWDLLLKSCRSAQYARPILSCLLIITRSNSVCCVRLKHAQSLDSYRRCLQSSVSLVLRAIALNI